MAISDNEFEEKENKIWAKEKIWFYKSSFLEHLNQNNLFV